MLTSQQNYTNGSGRAHDFIPENQDDRVEKSNIWVDVMYLHVSPIWIFVQFPASHVFSYRWYIIHAWPGGRPGTAAHPVDVPSQVKLKRASLPYAQATPPQHTRPPWRMQAGSPIGKVRRLYGQVVPLEMEVRWGCNSRTSRWDHPQLKNATERPFGTGTTPVRGLTTNHGCWVLTSSCDDPPSAELPILSKRDMEGLMFLFWLRNFSKWLI